MACARDVASTLPHYLRFEVDHILALSDDGEHEREETGNCCVPYCNRVKGAQGTGGFRMKMLELREHNVRSGVMVDARLAELTGRRLAQCHREAGSAPTGSGPAPRTGGPRS